MKFCIQIISICFVVLLFTTGVSAQNTTLFPGDVNDNGIANHIDLLYIGSAFNEAGNARVNYEFNFTANVSNGLPPYSYLWSSNNGFVSSEVNPSFLFDVAGNYTICVDVTDALNDTCTVCSTVNVGQGNNCNYTIESVPDILENTYQFSIDTVGIQSTTFEWTFGDNTNSNEPFPTHTFPAAGNYLVCLTTTDFQGETCTQCLDLTVGNLGNDLLCSIQFTSNDIINENTNWEALNTPILWDSFFINQINYAYADCDGDGFIDDLDVNVLEQNYGLTHGDTTFEILTTSMLGDPIISLGSALDTLPNPEGMTVELPIVLGDINNPVTDFYGIAFTIEYDPGYIVNDSINIQFLLNSWINPSNSGLISIQSNDPENGLIEASISRINRLSVNGFGEIGTVSFIIEDNLVGALQQDDNEVLDIRIRDVKMVNEKVENQAIASNPYRLFLDTSTAINTAKTSDFSIYPNPASDKIYIETKENDIQNIEIHDLTGNQLSSSVHTDNQQIILNTQDIPTGIYFIKIETYQSFIIQKIIIQKN